MSFSPAYFAQAYGIARLKTEKMANEATNAITYTARVNSLCSVSISATMSNKAPMLNTRR